MSTVGAGLSNPALNNNDPNADTASTVAANSGCMQFIDAFDNEYDDGLALPDSITIVSSAEDDPRHILQKDELDYTSNSIVPTAGEIPYSYVHNPPIKFNAIDRKIFIPNVEIHVEIIDYERTVLDHILNPNLYKIQLTHGPFKWVIHKRYKDFNSLHQQLRMFRASLNFPIPTKIHKERRAITQTIDQADVAMAKAANGQKAGKRRKKSALPKFPIKPDALVPFEAIPDRIKQLEEYLYNLLNIGLYRTHKDTIDFLEVSNLSFIAALGDKGKEGMIKKRTGSTLPGQAGCNFCGCFHATCCFRCNYFCSDVVCGKWRQRWIFVKDTCFGYIRPKDGVIRSVILFDQGFDVSTGMYHTGMRNGLQILTHSRYIVFKCVTRRQAKEWATYLKSIANTQARDFTYPNPHSSFAPLRPACLAGWFVDGASYMAEVANALEGATEEIFITDWWLSPEIYMKRPALDGDYWRLDKLLQRKAAQGVKIFVLLYKEVEMALGINSYYSKQRLVMQHENIKVMRHPDHARVGVLFWAHHEKLVIIDQTYAFVGGIDLCYGRWDDYRHRLVDMGSISAAVSVTSSTMSRKGVTPDPNVGVGALVRHSRNILVATSDDKMVTPIKHRPVLQPGDKLLMPETVEEIPENTKQNTPEMERRNVLGKIKDNMKTKGRDLMARITLNEQEAAGDASPKKEPDQPKSMFFNDDEMREGAMGGIASPLPFKHPMLDQLDGQAKLWIGKDYVNFIMKDFINLELPFADLVDRNTAPRMPWHDVATVVVGAAARDAARHFIERWNAVKLEKARENNAYPYLMPKSYNDIRVDDKFLQTPLHRVTCQVLRSVSSWNCGFIEPDCIEQSIHEAYLQTILKAQHYIYIENQFFISLEFGNPHVKNQVADTLFKRIIRAFKERKVFRVYVVMPLLPGFEGDVGGITGNSLRAITNWNYASICRGKNSLISRLRDAGIRDPFEYISFHSLRNHSKLNGTLVTELVYVHSKLMIADDKTVICGSANINDRSLIGKRDSEVCVILTDESFEEGKMNGETYPCGIYAGKLRKFLFKEHLGLLDPNPQRQPVDVTDPTTDAFWNGVWRRTSRRNTEVFGEVFHCIPSDAAKTFSAMKKYCDEPTISKQNPEAAEKELKRIQGFLVDLPLEFLCNETLTPPSASKEGLMPQSLWT